MSQGTSGWHIGPLKIKGKIVRFHIDPLALVTDAVAEASEIERHLAAHDLTPRDVIASLAELYPDLGVTIGGTSGVSRMPKAPPATHIPDAA